MAFGEALHQVRIENMTDEAILVFGNFIFGGTKEWSCTETGPAVKGTMRNVGKE